MHQKAQISIPETVKTQIRLKGPLHIENEKTYDVKSPIDWAG